MDIVAGTVLQAVFLLSLLQVLVIFDSRFFAGKPLRERLLAGSLTFCWLLSVIYSVLIPFGYFRPVQATFVSVALLIFVRKSVRVENASLPGLLQLEVPADGFRALWKYGFSTRFSLLIFVLTVCFHFVRQLALPLLGWDTLTYHGLKAGSWVQTGGWLLLDAPGAWESYRSFLGGGEVYTAWSMLFLRSDALAGLPDIFFWLATGLVCYCLLVQSGLQKTTSFITALALIGTVEFTRMVGTGYVDTTSTFFLLSGLFFSLQYLRNSFCTCHYLCFASLGLAAAVKVNAMAVAIVFSAVFLFLADLRTFSLKKFFAAAALFVAPLCQWLVFNWYITGYPLGCTPLQLGPFVLGALPPNLIWFFDQPDLRPYNLDTELKPFLDALGNFDLTLLLLLPAIWGFLKAFSEDSKAGFLRFSMFSMVLALYFSPQFSFIRLSWGKFNGRFIAPAILVFICTGLVCLSRFSRGVRALDFAAGISVIFSFLKYLNSLNMIADSLEQVFLLLSFLMTAVFLVIMSLQKSANQGLLRRAVAFASIFSLLVLPLLALNFKNRLRAIAFSQSVTMSEFSRYWAPGLAKILAEKEGCRIAFTYGARAVGHSVMIAPFFGHRFENELFYVTPDRSGKMVYHHPDHLKLADKDFSAWISRLRELDITHLICFYPKADELDWAEQHKEVFEKIDGNGVSWGIYRLNYSIE